VESGSCDILIFKSNINTFLIRIFGFDRSDAVFSTKAIKVSALTHTPKPVPGLDKSPKQVHQVFGIEPIKISKLDDLIPRTHLSSQHYYLL
jgi:hypothetical protein